MAKTAKAEEKKEKIVVDIADFFSTTNEKNGIWYEVSPDGMPTGLEVLLLGGASDENVTSADVYRKEHEEAEKEKNAAKRAEMERKAVCKRLGAIIKDLRCKEGYDIKIKGEPLSYSKETVYAILWESKAIRTDIFQASFDETNFMTKKD